jgi:hypothetical protein
MNKYTILQKDGGICYLQDIKDKEKITQVTVPIWLNQRLPRGAEFNVFDSREGWTEIAYICGKNVVINDHITKHKEAVDFTKGFYGLKDGSLDKIRFRITLTRSLLNENICPTLSFAKNILLFNNR